MEWKDELTPNEKKALSKYVNQKLESILGIRMSKTRDDGRCSDYIINRLFIL